MDIDVLALTPISLGSQKACYLACTKGLGTFAPIKVGEPLAHEGKDIAGNWYAATVVRENDDGTYTVNLFGGTRAPMLYPALAKSDIRTREKRRCAVKKSLSGVVWNADFWSCDLKASRMAGELVDAWNRLGRIDKGYIVVQPTLLEIPRDVGPFVLGEKVLVEDYFDGFQKFSSNDGWFADGSLGLSLHAFCHWTYHYSSGRLLMCDVQGTQVPLGTYRGKVQLERGSPGGAYEAQDSCGMWFPAEVVGHNPDGTFVVDLMAASRRVRCPQVPEHKIRRKSAVYVLTDPCLHSLTRSYGETDLGMQGMLAWFQNHVCNQHCDPNWSRPPLPAIPTQQNLPCWSSPQQNLPCWSSPHGLPYVGRWPAPSA